MRVAIIGCGAVGTAIAADLATDPAIELQVCSRTSFRQLVAEWPGGSSQTAHPVVVDPSRAGPAEWVFLCTKAHQVEAAATWFSSVNMPSTKLAILQNGVDHQDRVAQWAEQFQCIVPVVVQLPATRIGPGHTRQRAPGRLTVANNGAGRDFVDLFAHARIHAVAVDDFLTAAWRKLLWNASVGGACAIAQRGCSILRDPNVREQVHRCMLEICAVARHEGADLDDSLPDQLLMAFDKGNSDSWPSIAVDRRQGRNMEWRARNEVIVRLAKKHHVSAPANTQLVAQLQRADAALRDP